MRALLHRRCDERLELWQDAARRLSERNRQLRSELAAARRNLAVLEARHQRLLRSRGCCDRG